MVSGTNETMGTRIMKAREERGISKEQFACSIHTSRSRIDSWEHNKECPNAESLKQIVTTLGCSADYLLFGEEKKYINEQKTVIALVLLFVFSISAFVIHHEITQIKYFISGPTDYVWYVLLIVISFVYFMICFKKTKRDSIQFGDFDE